MRLQMKIKNFFIVAVLCMLCSHLLCLAFKIIDKSEIGYKDYIVGGTTGWFFNSTTNISATNYSSWASAQTFNLGDYLVFNTNSNQSVILTYNRTAYLTCTANDSDNETIVYSSGGPDGFGEPITISVPLTIVGPNYFFSDYNEGIQCQQGLTFQIQVQRGIGLPPSLNQPPPPPPPPPPPTPHSGAFSRYADVRVVVYGLGVALILLQLQF